MKLDSYNVSIKISDPDDPDTNLEVKFERARREDILKDATLSAVLVNLEEMA